MPSILVNLSSGQHAALQCLSKETRVPMVVYVRQGIDCILSGQVGGAMVNGVPVSGQIIILRGA